MRFQCDRCGKRYSTGQPLVEGRTYTLRCRSCGHKLVVRPPAPAAAGVETVPLPPPEADVEPDLPTTLPPPSGPPPEHAGVRAASEDDDSVAYVLPPLRSPTAPAAPPPAPAAPPPAPPHADGVPPPLPSYPLLAREPTPDPAPILAPSRPTPAPTPAPVPGPAWATEEHLAARRAASAPRQGERPGNRRKLAIVIGAGVGAAVIVAVVGLATRRAPAPAVAAPAVPAPAPAPAAAPPDPAPVQPAAPAFAEADPPPMERAAPSREERAPSRAERSAASRPSRRQEPPRRVAPPAPPAPAADIAAAPRRAEPAQVAIARPVEPAPAPLPELRPAPPPPPARPAAPPPQEPVALPIPPPPRSPEPAPATATTLRSAPEEARGDVLRLLLRKDVDGLGRSGEAVEVPQGYARNFLIPRGLAVIAPSRRGRDAPQAGGAEPAREDDPVLPGAGYRRPVPTSPQCVERGLRLAAEGRGTGSVTVKFAVGRTGVADLIQVQPGPDWSGGGRLEPRLVDAVSTAVRGCRFTPGADEQGRPARLWMTLQVQLGG